MTTIVACRSKRVIVADTRIVDGNQFYEADKIVDLKDGSVIATAGDGNLGEMFVDFLQNPKAAHFKGFDDYALFYGENKDNSFDALRLFPDGTLWHYGKSFRYHINVGEDIYGIGSGGALAAMLVRLGYHPKEVMPLVVEYGKDVNTSPHFTMRQFK